MMFFYCLSVLFPHLRKEKIVRNERENGKKERREGGGVVVVEEEEKNEMKKMR